MGVVAAGGTWELIWADFETADGIVGTPDGGVLFAQEQTDTIRKIDATGRESVYLADAHGPGAVHGSQSKIGDVAGSDKPHAITDLASCR